MSRPSPTGARRPPATAGEAAARLRRRFAAAGVESPASDAEALLCWALAWERARLHAHPEAPVPEEASARLEEAARRREGREPLAYILGEREFWSLPFRVGPGVLIPRPETELLVERAAALLGGRGPVRVLDLGAGCAAVAVALARELPGCRVTATDVSERALALARENARLNGVEDRVEFLRADLFEGLPAGERFEAVVSNPPYVCSAAIGGLMPEVARHEPREALDGGPDGMRLLRAIVQGAPARLWPRGILLLEMAPEQAPGCAEELRRTGAFGEPLLRRDLAGRERVLEAVKA